MRLIWSPLIRTIVREEVHRLVNQTQESLDSDPQSLEEIVQDEAERKFPPEPQEKQMCGERLTTDLFVSTADVPTCNALLPREKAVFDNSSKTADGTGRRWH
ncbi:hypothetical protein TNCV_1835931 [Trichonephila clavipes]|nr:hypothetical protein TNCV_1835931 [Trichonephila clavipes]